MQKYEGSFIAHDQSGEQYIIDIYVEPMNVDADVPETPVKGIRTLVTKNGDHVNYIRKGKYEIVRTDTILFCDDLSAP